VTVHLVFITHNRLDYTKKALLSILADPSEKFALTIWDNGSIDGTHDWLHAEVNDARIAEIVYSKENLGQTAAVNTVWANSGADLLGKLDNDCLVAPGWTRMLARAHEDIPELGVVACWHYFADDFDHERAKHKIKAINGHRIFRHPWTCGTGLLIKRETYKHMGPIQQNATTQYWLNMALAGYVNGFYYPLILQEHMDDPKSAHSHLKDEQSYQAAKAVTFNINRHGQDTLQDRWSWRQKVLDELLDGPTEPEHYVGWRRRARVMTRVVRDVTNRICAGVVPANE
jgi:glycosyltransferase involved in cell wall biosynthesis